MRFEIWDTKKYLLQYANDYNLYTGYYYSPNGYLRIFDIAVNDTTILEKATYTFLFTYEPFDLSSSISLSSKTLRLVLPNSF